MVTKSVYLHEGVSDKNALHAYVWAFQFMSQWYHFSIGQVSNEVSIFQRGTLNTIGSDNGTQCDSAEIKTVTSSYVFTRHQQFPLVLGSIRYFNLGYDIRKKWWKQCSVIWILVVVPSPFHHPMIVLSLSSTRCNWMPVRLVVQVTNPSPALYMVCVTESCLSDVMATYVSMGQSKITVRGLGDLHYLSWQTFPCHPLYQQQAFPSSGT